jgi:hypothetical protein
VKPVDIIEDIWVRDIVDLVWESFRLRRLKANLMATSAHSAIYTVLLPLSGGSDFFVETTDEGKIEWQISKLAEGWVGRDPEAINVIDRILEQNGLTRGAVFAQMLTENLDEVERIERMTAMAEARRNVVLREIDRHREALGHDLRRSVQQVEAADLRVIEGRPTKGDRSV